MYTSQIARGQPNAQPVALHFLLIQVSSFKFKQQPNTGNTKHSLIQWNMHCRLWATWTQVPVEYLLANTFRTSSSFTLLGRLPINTWWLSGAFLALILASLVPGPPRVSLDWRVEVAWGLGGGVNTVWAGAWCQNYSALEKEEAQGCLILKIRIRRCIQLYRCTFIK